MMKTSPAILSLLAASALLSGCSVDTAEPAGQGEQVGRAEQRLDQSCFYYESGLWIEFDCDEGGGDWDPPGPGEGEPPGGGEEGGPGTGGEEEGGVPVPPSLDAGIVFSSNGPIYGKYCTQIIEPSDVGGGWGNNYLCSTDYIGFRWSSDEPIAGMRCYRINEPAEPWTTHWGDNYLCVPNEARLILYWSTGGAFADANIRSVRFYEPQDPHTWNDNYLGYYKY